MRPSPFKAQVLPVLPTPAGQVHAELTRKVGLGPAVTVGDGPEASARDAGRRLASAGEATAPRQRQHLLATILPSSAYQRALRLVDELLGPNRSPGRPLHPLAQPRCELYYAPSHLPKAELLTVIERAELPDLLGISDNVDRLPRDAVALRRELGAALERATERVRHRQDLEVFLTRYLRASHGSQFGLMNLAMRLPAARLARLWLESIDLQPVRPASAPVMKMLRETIVLRLRALERRNRGEPPQKTFIDASSLARLTTYVAERRAGIREPEERYDVMLAGLPSALQDMVERDAAKVSLMLPQRAGEPVPTTYGVRDWEREAANWAAAGLTLVDDPAVNARLAIERASGVHLADHVWRRDPSLALTPAQEEVWRDVKAGRRFSPNWPPPFLPDPDHTADVAALGVGILLADSPTVRHVFAPLLDELPATAAELAAAAKPHGKGSVLANRMASWPPAFRAIAPRLLAWPRREDQCAALPWLLLAYMVDRAGECPRGRHAHVNHARVRRVFAAEPEVAALYIEMAPGKADHRRTVFGGALETQAVQAMRLYAPELLNVVPTQQPVHLPALAAVGARVSKSVTPHPLANLNFIGVQHLLADTSEMLGALIGMGLDPRHAEMVGIPYSTHELSAEGIRDRGIEVDTFAYRGVPYDVWREVQIIGLVERALARHAENGLPILCLDDGGYITKVLHTHFPTHAAKFCIVEQTTRGVRVAERTALGCPVIAVGRSRAKQRELPAVEASIKRRLVERLTPYVDPSFKPGHPALLFGFGWIGGIVAQLLASLGRELVIIDRDEAARSRAEAWAKQTGRSVRVLAAPTPEVIGEAALIAGTTGEESMSEQLMAHIANGTVVFSCSSANYEFAVTGDSHFHEDMLVDNGQGQYLALNALYPINFSGAGVVGDAKYFQYTVAALAEGCLQAAEHLAGRHRMGAGVQPLDPWRDRGLSEEETARGSPP